MEIENGRQTKADPHIGDHDIVEASRALLETHHIDIIPENERRGRPRDQFTLWFAANASVVAFVLGGLAIAFGLNLFWALVAIVVGNVLGAVLVSYHAWQGPRLGVPQMIQSRGQFGFYGAGFIFLASILLDVGYMAASQVLQGQALNLWAPSVSIPWWIIIATIPAVVVAIFGYRWIHNVQKVMTAIFIVVIAIALIQAALYGPVAHESLGFGLSSFPIFIAVIGLVFMNMLSWAPYVSDYSRYLPVDVSFRRTFWAIFSGQILSMVPFMALGAWVTALVPDAATNPLGALSRVAGVWILFFMALSQMAGVTLNAYSGMMALASLGSDVERFMEGKARQAVRVVGLLVLFAIGTILALLGYKTFLTSFENFINVLLFFFVPWSAINLVDYYLIRHGHYDVRSFFTRRGIYGNIRWGASIVYVITLAVQVPFLKQTFYTGSLVNTLHGADISWIVGFFLASVLYFIVGKLGVAPEGSLDRAAMSGAESPGGGDDLTAPGPQTGDA